MSDEEKKAIVELNHFSNMTAYWKQEEYTNSEIDNYIKIVLNLIEKQQKTIDEMAGYLAIIRDCPNENCGANLDCENRCNNDDDLVKECWKMYFERKIENER